MVENGAFEKLTAAKVAEVAHIGLGSVPKFAPNQLEPDVSTKMLTEFVALIANFQTYEQGYSSRRAMTDTSFDGDYDHLARFGEWDETQAPKRVKVGE